MPKLPVLKPREMISLLEKSGFKIVKSEGSHFRFHHPDGRRATVAFHNKPLKRGTLKSILRQSEHTIDNLYDFLHKK